ncbi:MAG: sugar ABC transporter permease [Lawsonibacter sp.]|nr:sugar ABC transporter permease [Lawsonibacter sp.]
MTESKKSFDLVKFLTKYAMVIALVVVFILFAVLTKGMMVQPQNMSNLLLQQGYVLVLACGMLLCILTGGNIDLSVGSVICMVGGIAAVMVTNMHLPAIPVILLCLVIGLLVGVWQGYWIGYVRIPPFITTLGGMFIFRGLGRMVLDSKTVAIQDPTFLNIFTAYIKIPGLDDGKLKLSPIILGAAVAAYVIFSTAKNRRDRARKGYRQNSALADFAKSGIIAALILWYCWMLSQYRGISVMLLWVVAVCLIYNFITAKTAFGRYFYAVGGNEKATKLSGINTDKIYFIAYANMGLLAGLCGLLVAARIGSVDGNTGTSYEMDAIGSCFIGGASAYGGSGTVGGVVIGALLLGVINMGMSIMGLPDAWKYVIKGGVLLVAVIFDVVTSRKSGVK